jgi:hypothetical protein
MAGTLAGAALSYWITQNDTSRADAATPQQDFAGGLQLTPQLGWAGTPLGLGVMGTW